MRQRDVRQARVVTLRPNGPNLWEARVSQWHASRLSMGTRLICRENNSTTKLVQNSNKSFRARRVKTNRGVFNYLRRLHIQRDYTEQKTGGIVGTKCELCRLRSVCVLQMKSVFWCKPADVSADFESSSNETESLLWMTAILTVRGDELGNDPSVRHAAPRGVLLQPLLHQTHY